MHEGTQFQDPAKRKRESEEENLDPLLLDVSLFSPFFKSEGEDPITEIGQVSGILAHFDVGITANNEALIHLLSEYREEHGKAGEAIRSIWLRVESLASSLEKFPCNWPSTISVRLHGLR